MAGSRKIWILKRDRAIEPFHRGKLRACLLRGLAGEGRRFDLAEAIAASIESFLRLGGRRCASSVALFEMALTALRALGMSEAVDALEQQHLRRAGLRARLAVVHGDWGPQARCTGLGGPSCTAWSKHWLVQQARTRWALARPVARILAGEIEQHLAGTPNAMSRVWGPPREERRINRQDVLAMLADLVAAYGLAPVPAPESTTR